VKRIIYHHLIPSSTFSFNPPLNYPKPCQYDAFSSIALLNFESYVAYSKSGMMDNCDVNKSCNMLINGIGFCPVVTTKHLIIFVIFSCVCVVFNACVLYLMCLCCKGLSIGPFLILLQVVLFQILQIG
jgi:hypothetical protein